MDNVLLKGTKTRFVALVRGFDRVGEVLAGTMFQWQMRRQAKPYPFAENRSFAHLIGRDCLFRGRRWRIVGCAFACGVADAVLRLERRRAGKSLTETVLLRKVLLILD